MSTSLEQQWKDRLEAYASSGLTKTAFCRKHDIPYHQFYYWMQKLQSASSLTTSTVQWMTVDVSSSKEIESSQTPLRLQVGNVTIEVVEGFNERLLRQVVKVLTNE
ncbi:hypothetical protein B0I26_1284 [Anoxybacillus vitaminiphilus]|jgi:transposase-like protein|uniref:Transposase n=1 Tax=Paranoxybacillus vitaminiphilus TaxID=581036 RepID=A0A327Y3H7_9BACL|nr:hypothetical protein [Anoxybacillus vitaminiphilus]RAK14931.1 hypothetical protein B0I26_1284 [Anoxybacillus vitaminiphilus]